MAIFILHLVIRVLAFQMQGKPFPLLRHQELRCPGSRQHKRVMERPHPPPLVIHRQIDNPLAHPREMRLAALPGPDGGRLPVQVVEHAEVSVFRSPRHPESRRHGYVRRMQVLVRHVLQKRVPEQFRHKLPLPRLRHGMPLERLAEHLGGLALKRILHVGIQFARIHVNTPIMEAIAVGITGNIVHRGRHASHAPEA